MRNFETLKLIEFYKRTFTSVVSASHAWKIKLNNFKESFFLEKLNFSKTRYIAKGQVFKWTKKSEKSTQEIFAANIYLSRKNG